MKKIVNYIKTNKIKSIIGLGVILSLIVVVISFSFANPDPNYNFIYNSVGTNNNYENNDSGSFSLNKKIEWIGQNKLKVTMTVTSKPVINSNNNDILLVVDTSSFLANDMLNDLKSSLTSVASYVTSSDFTRKIGIIEFNSNYTKYDFTNSLSTLNNNINSLSIGGGRSYYQAFNGIDDILTNRDTSRGLRVIFITTGISNINKSSELYKYEQIKNKYNLDINCIYYLTNKVLDQPNNYFSKEIVSNKSNLEVNIESLGIDSKEYNNFTVTDHYDTSKYSLVGTISDYDESNNYTNYGELVVNTTGEIGWVMEDSDDRPFYTGTTAKLEYELNYTGGTGNYALNSSNISVSKTIGQNTDNFTITDSLVVGNSYNVTYIANAPSGCTPSGSFGSSHKDVYEAVQHPADPTCSGYKFAGWKVVTEGVKKSDNGFIMPASNVEVKATWSKVSVVKSMNGDVKEVKYLYNILKKEAETGGKAREYDTFFAGQGYSHQDSYAGTGDKNIYFYYDENGSGTQLREMNNVIFANHCWQMIRTTDTGGVKMVYNGEQYNNKCEYNRWTHIGYTSTKTMTVSSDAIYYSDDYEYNTKTKKFSLKTNVTSSSWSNDYGNYIGKYTCNLTTSSGTCSNAYLILYYKSATSAVVLQLGSLATQEYYEIGNVKFDATDTLNSVAAVGYMYNRYYPTFEKSITSSTTYYYGSGYNYTYNSQTGEYEYSLTGATSKKGYSADISATHYTCWSNSSTAKCNPLSYVFFHEGSSSMYYINLSDNKTEVYYLNDMLNANDVNKYDSSIKLAVDKWYEHYILPYPEFTSKIEDVVFCNDRVIKNLGGWSPTGTQNVPLEFNYHQFDGISSDLNCTNTTDKFSVSNPNAKLKYPIGLLTFPEMNLSNSTSILQKGQGTSAAKWTMSPWRISETNPYQNKINIYNIYNGSFGFQSSTRDSGLAPVISLKAGTIAKSGDGSTTSPYIVE